MRKIAILVIIIIGVFSTIINAETVNIENTSAALIRERVVLLNNVYDENYSYESFSKAIKNIECSKLLDEDMKAFKELRECPGALEKAQIKKLNTEKIVKTKIGYDIYFNINWAIEGFEENYEESDNVLIKVVKNDEKWYLSYWENLD